MKVLNCLLPIVLLGLAGPCFAAGMPVAKIETSMGTIAIELDRAKAPGDGR